MRLRLTAALALAVVAATALPVATLPASAATPAAAVTPASATTPADTVHNYPAPSFGCLRTPTIPVGQTVTQSVESGGVQRTYRIHLPANYHSFIPTPVVMTFGGRNESSTAIEGYTGIDDLNAIAVYPDAMIDSKGETSFQGAPYSPVGVNDVLFVSDLLNQLQSTLCVDPFRIYADGKSNGGGFAALLACQLQHRIAAFGMVSGAFYPQSTVGCSAGTPVSLVEFHGTADTVINYDGDDSRQGSEVPAIMDWLAGWATHDHCAATPTSTNIGTDVVKFSYPGCAWFSSVQHYRVIDGGHTWPGATIHNGPGNDTQTISATALMWQFFLAHPLL